jgi:hypothetical protein
MCDGVHVRKKQKQEGHRGERAFGRVYIRILTLSRSKRARRLGLFMTLRSMTSRYASLVAPSAGCDPCLAHDDNS